MKAVTAVLMFIAISGSLQAEETIGLEFMSYEGLMAGKTPIQVDVPTEKMRGPQSVYDLKRLPGKELRRAPALEYLDSKEEKGEAKKY